jgi:tetratricopeptide (TPR) repeat protein
MSLNGAGRYDEAIDVLDRISTLDPDHIEGHLNRARAYIGKALPNAAASEFEMAIEKAPQRQEILLEAVKFHEQSGTLLKATVLLETGLLRIPGQWSLHYRLGVISQKQGNLEAAAKHFEKVLVLNRSYVPVRYNLGELHLALGDTLRAVREYEAFIMNWTGPKQAAVAVMNKLSSLR